MIIRGLEANKMHLKTQFFNYIVLHCIVFYDIYLTISAWIGLAITAKFTKGFLHDDVTYQHPLFVNNSNNNHYFVNCATNKRSVSTNGQLNSKINHFINN